MKLPNSKLNIVLCWHMHQPEYRDQQKNEYQLPWTYLHAIKDYTDMAAHIEENPKARAVVNFTPTLLEQLDDYSFQLEKFHNSASPQSTVIRDPLLAALASKTLPTDFSQRVSLIGSCLKANKERLIDRFPAYQYLAQMAQCTIDKPYMLGYLNDKFIYDLLVWYHLSWIGETIKRNDENIQALIFKEREFSYANRLKLIEIINQLISGIIPRYKTLAEKGQVELSVTPYAHPILPLLIDINSAKEAIPDITLPGQTVYPGGIERVHWHIDKGLAVFKKYFGFTPTGCWPSEGAVSDASLKLLSQHGFKWVASGGNVLHNSLRHAKMDEKVYNKKGVHHVYKVKDINISSFFRDDGLADLIGFQYSKWHADDAVANFIEHLEKIYENQEKYQNQVVSVILDGENAWEYFPENGYYFLNALYEKLSVHPSLNLTTFENILEIEPETIELPGLVAGSWVYGSFSTWIGDNAKNRGWDMLIEAKLAVDKVLKQQSSGLKTSSKSIQVLTKLQIQAIEQQLAICEGSDWFWWFGDYNSADSVSSFEKLYRLNLTILYQLLGQTAPDYLTTSFTFGGGDPATGGTMRPGQK